MADQRDLGSGLRRRLTYLLKYALLTLDELHAAHLEASGVTARELAVLLLLADREPESQQQAAQRLGIDRTSMVGLLDGLEAKALVIRRPDAMDRRRNVVELTEAGRVTLDVATRASDEAERELLADLDEADATHLRELLGRIATGSRADEVS
jgi:DNA-binding MarR family transcriptional regulator